MRARKFLATITALFAIVAIFQFGRFAEREDLGFFSRQSQAQEPSGATSARGHYYPGTEELRPDEMRVISCGTGAYPTTVAGRLLLAGRAW